MTHKGTITLETASLDDCHVLAEMNKQLIDDEGDSNAMTVSELEARMRKWLSEGLYTAYLFKVNGTIAAYALVDTTDKPPWVRHFFVCREYRRQRYGRMAVNALIDELKANEIGLSCLSENARGLAFWRSFNHKQHSVKFRISKGTPKLTFAPYGLNADREFLLAAHTETFLLTFKKEITPEQ
ncbi:MAG: GNAT family N-acetyltransferase, partial [Oscillospiraceae bacterium]|nr:GNAT family N-acetyltransferase [Oscillospiraceae bacterium]